MALTIETSSGQPTMQKWLPVIDADLCTGCDLCVDACGPASLEVIDAISVLVDAHFLRQRGALHRTVPRRCDPHGLGDLHRRSGGGHLASRSGRLTRRSPGTHAAGVRVPGRPARPVGSAVR